MVNRAAEDEDDPVLTALHRLYFETLSDDEQQRMAPLLAPSVHRSDVSSALQVLHDNASIGDGNEVAKLTRWHLVATALVRRDDVFVHDERLPTLAGIVGGLEQDDEIEAALKEFGEAKREGPISDG